MLNEHLLQQVREGKASIWVADVRANGVNNKINTVKQQVYAKSKFTFERTNYYYYRDKKWYYSPINPTGLTTIPLDRFFEVECEHDLRGMGFPPTPFCIKCNQVIGSVPAPDHVPDTGNMGEELKDLEEIRNFIVDAMPVGDVKAWDCILAFKRCIKFIDLIIEGKTAISKA